MRMCKGLFILGLFILCLSNLNAEIGRQDSSVYFNVSGSTSTLINISSTTYSTSSVPNGIKGVERWFRNEGETTIFIQRGGSPETILLNKRTLRGGEVIIDDTYFGDYYFQTKAGSSELSITVLTKS